jgi:hypothetical protein
LAARKTPSSGGKPDKLMRDAISLALHREAKAADGTMTKKLVLVASALVDKAIDGDIAAIKEINDRMDGKAVQPLEGTNDGPPIQQVIRWLR